jgi:hypothetical protein
MGGRLRPGGIEKGVSPFGGVSDAVKNKVISFWLKEVKREVKGKVKDRLEGCG